MSIPLPPNTQNYQVNPANYVAGRGSCPAPLAIVLHGQPFDPGEVIAKMCRDVSSFHRDVSSFQSPHESFHYAIKPSINWMGAFVPVADTAIAIASEVPPTLPAGCTGSTPDQKTINVLVDWSTIVPILQCPPKSPDFSALCVFLASIFSQNNIVPSAETLLVATKELAGLDLPALLQCVKNYIAAPPATLEDRACLPPHLTTQNTAASVVVWEGNCLREATKTGTSTYCTYTAQIEAVDDGKLLSVTIGDKTYIAPNGGIAVNDVLAIRAWLNGLVVAPAYWNVTYGFNNNVAQLTLVLLMSNKPATAIVFSNATITPVESDCVELPAQIPVTLSDVLAQPQIPLPAMRHALIKVNWGGGNVTTAVLYNDTGFTFPAFTIKFTNPPHLEMVLPITAAQKDKMSAFNNGDGPYIVKAGIGTLGAGYGLFVSFYDITINNPVTGNPPYQTYASGGDVFVNIYYIP